METLIVKLKQQTPLIHFQHDQYGATLRASEVKPKLDRFIIKTLFDDCFDDCKTLLIGYSEKKETELKRKFTKGYRALNYQLKVVPGKLIPDVKLFEVSHENLKKGCDLWYTETSKRKEFPFLLANMGGKERREDLLNLKQHEFVDLHIITTFPQIRKHVYSLIAMFFANNNFGQRSTKGFGSFTVVKIDEKVIPWKFKEYYKDGTPLMQFSIKNVADSFDKMYTLFEVLDFYWKCLKSGVNYTRRLVGASSVTMQYPERYIKSFLWEYLNSLGKNWEKKAIKSNFHLGTPFPGRIFAVSNPFVFGRALLGCPDKYEYKIPQGPASIRKRGGKYVERIIKETVSVNHVSKIIERIPSPIIFKPQIENDIVSVFVLFDNDVLNRLAEQKSLEYCFQCKSSTASFNLGIDLKVVNHLTLIQQFHKHFGTNIATQNNIFWKSEIPVKDRAFKMIPRDYNWNNILGGDNFVSFWQIKK